MVFRSGAVRVIAGLGTARPALSIRSAPHQEYVPDARGAIGELFQAARALFPAGAKANRLVQR